MRLAEGDDVLGQRQDRGRLLELPYRLGEVAPPDGETPQTRDRGGVVRHDRESRFVGVSAPRRACRRETRRLPSSVWTYAVFSGASAGDSAAWRIAATAPSRLPWSSRRYESAGQRGEVDAQGDELLGRHDRLVVAPELDERVDLDRVRGRERRREVEGPVGRLERGGELVTPELEPADPDEDQRVVRCELAGPRQGFVGLVVEGRIGGLADALEQRRSPRSRRATGSSGSAATRSRRAAISAAVPTTGGRGRATGVEVRRVGAGVGRRGPRLARSPHAAGDEDQRDKTSGADRAP